MTILLAPVRLAYWLGDHPMLLLGIVLLLIFANGTLR